MATHLKTWGTYWLYGGQSGPEYGDVWGQISVYVTSQSPTKLTSTIQIDHYAYLYIRDEGDSWNASISSYYGCKQGSYPSTSEYKSVSKTFNKTTTGESKHYIGSTTHTVYHNNDGTGTLYVKGYIKHASYTTTSSFTVSLPTIPTASTLTATRANVGETSQLTVTKKNESYNHSIQYSFGNLSGYILADGSATSTETKISEKSIGFTIPTSFYAQMSDTREKQCTLTIKTYNGNTQIGSAQTATFYVEVPDNSSNQPNLTVSVVDINETTKALTDVDTKLIKGYSTARVSYSASGKNSASIKTVTINGETVTGSPVDYAKFSADTIKVVVTDSRTLTTEKTPSYTLIDYFDPTVSMSAKRTAPTESEIKMTFSGNFYNGSFGSTSNALTLSWVWRIKGNTNWTTGGNLTSGTHYKISGNTFHSGTGSYASEISLGKIFSYENTYEIGITYGDKLYGPVTTVTTVSKGKPVIGWKDKEVNVEGDIKRYNVNILEIMYPVGSIYTSVLDKNPKDLFNFGTWERIQDMFLFGASDTHPAGEEGGSETVTLTEAQMPKHNHVQTARDPSADTLNPAGTGTNPSDRTGPGPYQTTVSYQNANQQKWTTGWTMNTHSKGNSEAHDNMPPYLSVYMWKRVQ
jgi:hypothetical protein